MTESIKQHWAGGRWVWGGFEEMNSRANASAMGPCVGCVGFFVESTADYVCAQRGANGSHEHARIPWAYVPIPIPMPIPIPTPNTYTFTLVQYRIVYYSILDYAILHYTILFYTIL